MCTKFHPPTIKINTKNLGATEAFGREDRKKETIFGRFSQISKSCKSGSNSNFDKRSTALPQFYPVLSIEHKFEAIRKPEVGQNRL